MQFSELELNPKLVRALLEQEITEPTPIQEKVIPLLIESDRDLVGQAQTGTGKTLAFALPLLQKLNPKSTHIQSLILAPTRELANQVHNEIKKTGKYSGVNSIAVYGGASYQAQIRGIRSGKPQIVVGTPGRVLDLIKRNVLILSEVEYLVLDEADEMLNMGFLEDVKSILSCVNEESTQWMFSATMPKPILKLIEEEFTKPQVIRTKKENITASDIEQFYFLLKRKNFLDALSRILDSQPDFYGIVFCQTKMDTRELSEALLLQGYIIETLHGEMGQNEREISLARFKSKKSKIMVCTDVASRGIDVNDLTHVINYGLPQDPPSYVHRIGRTGRAGKKGTALTLADTKSHYQIQRIERFIKKPIKLGALPKAGELKKALVLREVEKVTELAKVLLEKGDDFSLDPTFEIFEESLGDVSREDLLRIFFSHSFKDQFRKYNNRDSIDEKVESKRPRGKGGERSRGSNGGGRHQAKDGNVRLFLNVGKDDGLTLNTLLNTFSERNKVPKNHIQNVVLKNRFSFFEVPGHMGEKFIKNTKFKLKSRKVRIEFTQNK